MTEITPALIEEWANRIGEVVGTMNRKLDRLDMASEILLALAAARAEAVEGAISEFKRLYDYDERLTVSIVIRARLDAALKVATYAVHKDGCPSFGDMYPCKCGLVDALSSLSPEK